MKSRMFFKLRSSQILPLAIMSITGTMAVPAYAQSESLEEVIVTGSRIVRRDFEANSPISTVDSEFLESSSSLNLEAALNQLPQFVPSLTQFAGDNGSAVRSSSTLTLGASTVSLRGLGSNRNLVLIDGRRGMPVNATMAVDINSIPSSAIGRIETITGGASAVYGGDAMAGVVNFVLKKDFEGAEFDIQYGIPEQGEGDEMRLSLLFGTNFADGRGNVTFGVESYDRKRILELDTDFFQKALSDPETTYSTGQFWPGTTYDSTGSNSPSQIAVDSVFAGYGLTPGSISATGSTFGINSDGSLYAGIQGGGFAPRPSNVAGIPLYNGSDNTRISNTGRRGPSNGDPILQSNATLRNASTPLERHSMFGSANFDLTDKITVFAQGTFAQTKVKTIAAIPGSRAPWDARIPHGSGIVAGSLLGDGVTTNPDYMTGGRYGLDCGASGGCTNSQAYPTPAGLTTLLDSRANPDDFWFVNKGLDYVGPIGSEVSNTTYQLIAGLKGSLDAIDGSWEIYGSTGETKSSTALQNMISLEAYRAVMQSPNYGQGFTLSGNAINGGFLAGTGNCTSGLPIFTDTVSQDCVDAIARNINDVQSLSQDILEATLQGKAFDLPAGEARFSVGISSREIDYSYLTGSLRDGNNFIDQILGATSAGSTKGSTKSKDIFGELLLPILRDASFAQSLDLELGYRYSDDEYAGGIDTYKALFSWGVNDKVRFRGGFQVANRAPNIAELFLAESTGFPSLVVNEGDFCSELNPTATPYSANPVNANASQVKALCSTLMTPIGADSYYVTNAATQPDVIGPPGGQVKQVGTLNIESEKADTITIGGVFDSPWDSPALSQMRLTVDWYEIDISGMIGIQSPYSVYRQCFDPAFNPGFDANNEFCQKITRNPVTGSGSAPVEVSYTNEQALKTSGIDVQLDWSADLADIGLESIPGSIGFNFMANILLEQKFKSSSFSDVVDYAGSLGSIATGLDSGTYDYRTFVTLSYTNGPLNLALRWRYLPEVDDVQSVTSPNIPANQKRETIDDYNIFDLSGGYAFGESYFLRFGIDNLFDADPSLIGRVAGTRATNPFSDSATGSTNAGFYNTLGRRFFVGLKASF